MMMNDDEFLRTIAENVEDDSTRLLYADWLDGRGDPRAAFLRLQQALARLSPGAPGFREFCEQEQELVSRLDPAWIQRVRRYTTAAPCRDLKTLVPDLAPAARTTTRLHPHRAAAPLPVWVSKIGGRFLWPRSEPWPACAKCHVDLTPVIQLRRRDIADTPFPPGTDLLQLFWCPDEEAHRYVLAPHIVWRASASVTVAREDDPDLGGFPRESDWQGIIPLECAVYPERVIEYAIGDDLDLYVGQETARKILQRLETMDFGPDDDLADRLTAEYGPRDPSSLAFSELGECPASKVGGKAPLAHLGRQFDHLVTLSTWEFDSGSFRRWLAVEDQRLLAPAGERLTWTRLRQQHMGRPLQEVLGMQLGRTQRADVYVCIDREPWDVVADIRS